MINNELKAHKYLAIYFRLGCYNEDDNIPVALVGFDCPFDDSPVLYARNEEELGQKIKGVYAGDLHNVVDLEINRNWDGADWKSISPDLICDSRGNIMVELYKKITSDQQFNPDLIEYSLGRETLTQLWEREKGRWVLINSS